MVTIIPKPLPKTPQWQIILFYFSLALLITTVVVYFVLSYFHQKSLATIDDLEAEILGVTTAEDLKIETEVFADQGKIKDFAKLFSAHQNSSKFFEFLEGKTHPQVWFSDLELNPPSAKAKLAGSAKNFQALAQQIYIFQKEDLIEEIKLTNLSLGEEGETEFSLDLSLSPNLFSQVFY